MGFTSFILVFADSVLASIIPNDSVEHSVGETALLVCHTEENIPAVWTFMQAHESSNVHDGVGVIDISNGFHTRFTVDRSASGIYNLVIENVQPEDAGIYRCTSQGKGATDVELIVLSGNDDVHLYLLLNFSQTMRPLISPFTPTKIVNSILYLSCALSSSK